MNPNLEEERKKCSINVFELASFLHSNTDSLDQFLLIQKMFEEDPLLKFKPEDIGASTERTHILIAQRNASISKILKAERNIWIENYINCIVDLPVSSSVHSSVCIPYLKLLASDEQLATILPKAEAFQIQICYCSAELAHGSDLNSVQTEAHYDEKTDEFIINTPHPGATKWWIGDYGKLATHAIVFSQLFVNKVRQGVAAFLIPIRNTSQQAQLLPGIEVGDVETKHAGAQNDNGFVKFNQLRVTKESLLQRYITLNKKGQIQLQENKKILLANMIQKRLGHVLELGLLLAQASTIAVRFSLVQDRYYNDQFGTKYIKNLDYQVIQQKVLPQLSQSYIILLTWFEMKNFCQRNIDLCQKGDFSLSSEVKAISNGLKVFTSRLSYIGVENLRQACGNVGLSQYSGFNQILSKISSFPLYEADSVSLSEYTAKFLQKKLKDKNDESPYTKFLNHQRVQPKCNLLGEHEFEDLTNLLFILEQRAQFLALTLQKKIEQQEIANKTNQTSLESTENLTAELSDAFIDTVLLRSFKKRITKINQGQFDIIESFKSMGIIYALGRIINTVSDYIQYEYISVKQLKLINSVYKKHLEKLRTNAIGLVDSFSLSDNSIKSAIGVFSGQAYETLNDWVQNKNPNNSEDEKRIITNAVVQARSQLIQQQPKF
ncbi:hypothetical protein ABPG74_005592 [Tetrahymena malaccensis]